MNKSNQLSTLNFQLTKSKEFSMKNALKLIGIFSFAVIIAFTMTAAGCDNGTTGGGGNKPTSTNYTEKDLQGTWKWTNPSNEGKVAFIFTFSGNNFTFQEVERDGHIDIVEGTFTVKGSTLTVRSDHVDFNGEVPFSISDNKLILKDFEEDGIIFIKQ
jgi:hypothetical protein